MLCCKMTDMLLIKSRCVHATVMYNCMQLKVKITDNPLICEVLTTEVIARLILSIKVGVA